MKIKALLIIGSFMFASAGAFIVTGCCNKSGSEINSGAGPAEKAGAALDKAVDKAVDKAGDEARKLADKTRDETKEAASQAVIKAGEALEKTGTAMEKTGSDIQDSQKTRTNP